MRNLFTSSNADKKCSTAVFMVHFRAWSWEREGAWQAGKVAITCAETAVN